MLLPLPASPPYDIHGRLGLQSGRYAIEDLAGRIGATDILASDLLKLADLGPLVGVQTKSRPGKQPASQAGVANQAQAQAQASEHATRGDRILPAGTFDPARFRLIDADATLVARRVEAPGSLPIEGLKAALHLHDAVLRLEPLELGVAAAPPSPRRRWMRAPDRP